MPKDAPREFPVLPPDLQVSFYYRLGTLRQTYLQGALKATIDAIDLPAVDRQLAEFVPAAELKRVASFGLRGEVFFPIPVVLEANSFLLGYYRLLYGLSQKEFYAKGPFGRFKRMEDDGDLPPATRELLPVLCRSLVQTATKLVDGLDDLSLSIVHELQLLTIGPQLRGSENTRIGEAATRKIMDLIVGIVAPHVKEQTRRSIRIENASGRPVLIEFASDPDVRVTEKLESTTRTVVSIEIKGGTDASNIHNRLGEAEKSHLKEKKLGCTEFWTVIRVDVPLEGAHAATPTTTQFFHLDRICDQGSAEHVAFREALSARLGIK